MNKFAAISDYYKLHFTELAPDKQFHFASRLFSWNNDDFSRKYLQENKTIYLHDDDTTLIKDDLAKLLNNPPTAKINAAKTRQKYFDRYPALRGRMLALFRVRHLLTLYGVDVRSQLLELCSLEDFRALSVQLQQDPEALKILSTYAINYIYLVDYILFPNESDDTFVASVYKLGEDYDITEPEQIQLLIYLYTHCIIGEANFYSRNITASRKPIYEAMLARLEITIRENFTSINLDNKLEYLVCCRILSVESSLFDPIYAECGESFSKNGTFLVDTINTHSQSNKTSLSDSEHRNVLGIMSTTAYAPSDSLEAK